MAESHGRAWIDNAGLNRDGSTDYGLMQINSIHADMVGGDLESLRNPAVNIRVAYSLSHQGSNWTAWSAYNSGAYREYLK
jgi:lysozyme-related protein Hpa2